jgi:hypothetical protein
MDFSVIVYANINGMPDKLALWVCIDLKDAAEFAKSNPLENAHYTMQPFSVDIQWLPYHSMIIPWYFAPFNQGVAQ